MTLALLLLPAAAAAPDRVPAAARAHAGRRRAGRGAGARCVLSAVAIARFDVGGGTQFVTDRLWISDLMGGADVRFHIAMDGLSLFMVAADRGRRRLRRAGRRSRAGRDRIRRLLGAAVPARGLAGDAVHRPRPGAVLRRLGDHDDRPVRADGRLGRRPAAARRRSSSSSTR